MHRPAAGQGRACARPPLRRPPRLEPLEERNLLAAPFRLTDVLVQLAPTAAVAPGQPLLPGVVLGRALDGAAGLYQADLNGVGVADALAALAADPFVLQAGPDLALSPSSVPNDPLFGSQWGLSNTGQNGGTAGVDIGAPAAWAVTAGSYKTVVAAMDTGIDYDHPDLYRNVWLNRAEIPRSRLKNLVDVDGDGVISFADLNNPVNQGVGKITDVNGDGRVDAADVLAPMVKDANGNDTGKGGWADGVSEDGDTAHVDDLVGWNFVTDTNRPFDDNGHGTQVAGIIGATGDNGVGVAGVAWRVSLMACKFMAADGQGYISDFIAALGYAAAHGAKVANNSWAGAAYSAALSAAIDQARQAGVVFVAAAGNYGRNTDTAPTYPADFKPDNIITVAAIDRNGRLASFSDYGPHSVDVGAPGVDILSPLAGGGCGLISGTSAAAPFVSGVAALVWSEHPTWTYLQVIDQILHTARPTAALSGKTVTGGRVEAAAAVGATGTTATPPPPPAPPPVSTGKASVWTASARVAITGGARAVSALTITQDEKIGQVEVKLSLTYPADGDLFLYLEAPNGTKVLLSDRRGGTGANFAGTLFDAAARAPVGHGTAPFAGVFRPEGLFSNLVGLTTKGTWKLVVVDRGTGRVGRITDWSLIVTPAR
jgi:subtilisin family serine protease